MTFLLPIGLLAFLTLPLILLLHLIRERRRRVAVPSLLLWRNVLRKQINERRRRLPLTLLLLLQLLVAGAIALALGRPQIFTGLVGRADQLAIVLDTSTSMLARNGAQTRFIEAQQRAAALLRDLGPNGQATLIAAGPSARIVAAGEAADLPALEAALNDLQAGGTGSDLDGALVLAEAALDLTRPARIVVLTDGAAAVQSRAVAAPVDWQMLGSAQPNRAIITFATRSRGTTTQVYARIGNYDSTRFDGTVRLYDGDQQVDASSVTIDPQREAELTWKLAPRTSTLRIELDGADALPEDDRAYVNATPTRQLNVLLVSDTPDALQRALGAVPGVQVAAVAPGSYAAALPAQDAADLTVFDGFLPTAWPNSPVLVVHPPDGSTLLPTNAQPRLVERQPLTQRGATLAGLNFDSVSFGLVTSLTPPDWARVELASGDTPLILRGSTVGHEVAIWTFNLANGNLPNRLAFPLLVARTVRDLAPAPLPDQLAAGEPLELRPSARAESVKVARPDGGIVAQVPVSGTLTLDTLTQPGWYHVEERGADGTVFAGQLAVNAGAVAESNLREQIPPALLSGPRPLAADAERIMLDLWPWLALAALVLLMLEWGYVHRRRA